MDDYAGQVGRLLADRYRLPRPLDESYHLTESVAYDTASGQEVLVRQVPLPEVVEAEFVADGESGDAGAVPGQFRGSIGKATRRPADPAVRRAVEAAIATARIPDHPRLDQVFDVFVEGDGLWIVSELLPATPLASLLDNQKLTPHRAAEIAADVLTALRTVHAHGWTHRNVTSQTVLICDDGRALLTGLAVGAAQEALCGYSPFPDASRSAPPPTGTISSEPARGGEESAQAGPGTEMRRTPATWTGSPLPAGFEERQDDEPRGGGGPRGIFGPQGLTPGNGPNGPAVPPSSTGSAGSTSTAGSTGSSGDARPPLPVRHGYETGGRGPRGGAIAAAQVSRRVSARTESVEPEDARQPERGRGEESGTTRPSTGTAYVAPDDYVRWLPSGADEVTPADLPDSSPVKATWRSAETEEYSGPEGGTEERSSFYDDDTDDFVVYDVEDASDDDAEDQPWDGDPSADQAESDGFRGPTTALAAERARQARMTVVGAVSERWAPEQAGPVHNHWRLAPPVGPAADLWALGALLFRAVQGHAPYPEDDVAELVEMVCARPPSFAEDCGPLRPVVESLMRQDSTERPDFEELRGCLRSLVRSAPEPEAGWHTLFAPLDMDGPADPRRLPILRRRGELVRRRRAKRRAASAERRAAAAERQRQKKARLKAERPKRDRPTKERPKRESSPREWPQQQPLAQEWPQQEPPAQQWPQQEPPTREWPRQESPQTHTDWPEPAGTTGRERQTKKRQQRDSGSRGMGRVLVGLVLVGLTAAVLYVSWFMPKGDTDASNQQRGSVGEESQAPGAGSDDQGGGGEQPADPEPSVKVPEGYKLSRDPAGFQVAVPEAWNRRSTTGRGQVRYNGGQVEMVIVNGRDDTGKYGKDPMAYQSDDEPELAAYRAADWVSTSGLRRIDVGETAMAEGTFIWRDNGRQVYARNRAMILDGRYHVLMVMGSKSKKQEIDRHFEAVADTYGATRR